jgi:hypothetical protein
MRVHHLKWLVLAGLVAGGLKVYHSRTDLQRWLQNQRFRVEGLDLALPSEVYFLETNRWLEFSIPKDTPIGRLISNASISPTEKVLTGIQWPYAIEYELRDSQRRLISEGVYHLKGEQLVFVDKHSGKPVEVNIYLDRRFNPLSGRHWILNLRDPSLTNADTLRLRLNASHPDLLNVAVRVYFKTEVPEHKLGYMWSRLSDDEKRDLAKGNVYSFEGLTPQEKLRLIQYRWSAAAPEGIPGRHFRSRTLYVRNDTDTMQVLRNWVPAGIAVDPDHWGVLPVTNVPGVCWLQMFDQTSGSAARMVSNTFLWHGDLQQRIDTNQFSWSGTNQSILLTNRNGLLQIRSASPLYARAFQVESGITNEITPEPVHLLTFTASPTNSVLYDIEHVGKEPTLFRVDLRRFVPSPANTNTGLVHYALLDRQGGTFQAGDVTLTNLLSPYDWLVVTNYLTNITVPQSLCFVLPPAVKKCQLSSQRETLFVTAYSRPFDLVKKVQVPDDYSAGNSLTPGQPSWFTLQPADHVQRREAGQASVLRIQARLPEYDPLVLAGEYAWDSFLPETDASGQMLLLAPTPGEPVRPDSLQFTYFPVLVGGAQRVCLLGQPWEPQVEPTLMVAFSNGIPRPVTVTLDGQTIYSNWLEASVNCIRLGNLKVGEHDLGITSASPASAFLNYCESADPPAYLQRFCVTTSSNVLSFPYVKRQAEAEMLVLRAFSRPEASCSQRFEVHLKLKSAVERGVGPFSDLTFMEREAQITPGAVGQSCLVAATPAQLDDGQPLFFPMGPDLPPGQYEVEVSVVAPAPRWFSLSRTTPGLAEKLALTLQRSQY